MIVIYYPFFCCSFVAFAYICGATIKVVTMKKPIKEKSPVKIRIRDLKNGNKTIYLDIYQKGERRYEYLNMYLLPDTTPANKQANNETWARVCAYRDRVNSTLYDSQLGFKPKAKTNMTLLEFLEEREQTYLNANQLGYVGSVTSLKLIIKGYKDIKLANISTDYIRGFIRALNTQCWRGKEGRPIKAQTKVTYFSTLNTQLNAAAKSGLIDFNPCTKLSSHEKPHGEQKERVYLTTEELKNMINTPIECVEVKNIFLFSCFTGLRISDILDLEWTDIVTDTDGNKTISKNQIKTKTRVTIPLTQNALACMPAAQDGTKTGKVFDFKPSYAYYEKCLKRWGKAAGVNKNLSSHVGRHTFATLLINNNADLYTTSKLLGHTSISHTQIYARILDDTKKKAVCQLDNIFSL